MNFVIILKSHQLTQKAMPISIPHAPYDLMSEQCPTLESIKRLATDQYGAWSELEVSVVDAPDQYTRLSLYDRFILTR